VKLFMRQSTVGVKIKCVSDQPAKSDGHRILVDRIWLRGLTKSDLQLEEWLREIAPSTGLRKWFRHDPAKWEPFKRKYAAELSGHREEIQKLARDCKKRTVTPLFAAKDSVHNNPVALKEYVEALM
jgi:uncharacterized protein YeaO (DUF488 family)